MTHASFIDCLLLHGFSSSYSEVQMYERSAAVHHGTDITTHTPDMFLQHLADNVDHNIKTLDGLGTFHGMGIITTVTPGNLPTKPVPRVTVTSEDVIAVGKVHNIFMSYFKPAVDGMIPLNTMHCHCSFGMTRHTMLMFFGKYLGY